MIVQIVLVVLLGFGVLFTPAYAVEVFRSGITKIVEACQTESFEEIPTSEVWLSFDTQSQLTIAFNSAFEEPIVMKMVRYVKSRTRAEFVAVRSDAIRPGIEVPSLNAWFYSIYGKITLSEENLQPVSVNGDVHASYISPEGNQNAGRQCLLRFKFRSIERRE